MKPFCSLAFLFAVLALPALAAEPDLHEFESPNFAPKLGYGKDDVVVILHADDMGMCEEANEATARSLMSGGIQSTSIMMTCPAALQAVEWCAEHPEVDAGIHATLTSEWKTYRWGPLTPSEDVPGLLDPDLKLWRSAEQVARHATAAEVAEELRAQIETAIAMGLKPTHVDSHMGTLYARPDYLKAMIDLAVEFELAMPVPAASRENWERYTAKRGLPMERLVALLKSAPFPKLRSYWGVPHGSSYAELREKFIGKMKSLRPGLHYVFHHPSTPSERLKAITNSWKQRNWEAALFNDPVVRRYFETTERFKFGSWREWMKRYQRYVASPESAGREQGASEQD